jgi:hypothetical protein
MSAGRHTSREKEKKRVLGFHHPAIPMSCLSFVGCRDQTYYVGEMRRLMRWFVEAKYTRVTMLSESQDKCNKYVDHFVIAFFFPP